MDSLIQSLEHSLDLLTKQTASESVIDYKTPISKLNEATQTLMKPQMNNNVSMRETQFYWEQFNYLFGLAKNLEQAIMSVG